MLLNRVALVFSSRSNSSSTDASLKQRTNETLQRLNYRLQRVFYYSHVDARSLSESEKIQITCSIFEILSRTTLPETKNNRTG